MTPPESVAKKVKRNEDLQKQKDEKATADKAALKTTRHEMKMRANAFEKEYRLAQKSLVDLRRQAKAEGNFFVEPEAKLIFCTRIAGINKLSPKPRKILQLLRLNQLHNGVFLKVTRPIINRLRYVAPYVTFGYPTLSMTRELIYKRGHLKVNGSRMPMSNG